MAIHWIITCNFSEFWIYRLSSDGKGYDISKGGRDPTVKFSLEDLPKNIHRLKFLTAGAEETERLDPTLEEKEVSIEAGEIIKGIYDDLLKSEKDLLDQDEEGKGGKLTEETLLSINVFCVRLVFCLYAENSGLFGDGAFRDYLSNPKNGSMRQAIENLFKVLDSDPVARKQDDYKHLVKDYEQLENFPYVNGGLFRNKIKIPSINDKAKKAILKEASAQFNWRGISPTIFGAIFESTLNQDTREEGGMYYTPPANIHKVIDPLFLNKLKEELKEIKASSLCEHDLADALDAFQEKLASLTFLDPACGSGNFLTETFRSLRDLENEAILLRVQQSCKIVRKLVKVSINQFYGIEINDFAVAVAKTAMWIADCQKFAELKEALEELKSKKEEEGKSLAKIEEDPKKSKKFLPLFACANIAEGNALADYMNWECLEVEEGLFQRKERIERGDKQRPSVEYDYIIGNPPFIGSRKMTTKKSKVKLSEEELAQKKAQRKAQKKELKKIVGKYVKNAGKIDYVAGWFFRAAEYLEKHAKTRVAFVATNSTAQGEQAALLWEPLLNKQKKFRLHIDFAYRTFRWESESKSTKKAHVHCVIVGFSSVAYEGKRTVYDVSIHKDGKKKKEVITQTKMENINAYLLDAREDVFIENQPAPLCKGIPSMVFGNMPRDGGHLTSITADNYDEFLKDYPVAKKKFVREYVGADEFIKGTKRWCLWLVGATQEELELPDIDNCVRKTREFREDEDRAEETQELAKGELASLFAQRTQSMDEDFLLVPSVSSEKRRYIPMGFLPHGVVCSNLVSFIPNASLFHFGVLTSDVHMAWVRAICGRLETRYRYSGDFVYNNFPWVKASTGQIEKIEQTARGILHAREIFQEKGWTLEDLYREEEAGNLNSRKKRKRTMPEELRKAHKDNDEAVRELFGFQVDTEQEIVSKLFDLYYELLTAPSSGKFLMSPVTTSSSLPHISLT